jgi:hypothetical protein
MTRRGQKAAEIPGVRPAHRNWRWAGGLRCSGRSNILAHRQPRLALASSAVEMDPIRAGHQPAAVGPCLRTGQMGNADSMRTNTESDFGGHSRSRSVKLHVSSGSCDHGHEYGFMSLCENPHTAAGCPLELVRLCLVVCAGKAARKRCHVGFAAGQALDCPRVRAHRSASGRT